MYVLDEIDLRDKYEEQAAKYEYGAGMRRGAAEAQAWKDVYGAANPPSPRQTTPA